MSNSSAPTLRWTTTPRVASYSTTLSQPKSDIVQFHTPKHMLTEAEIATTADICETLRLQEYLHAGSEGTGFHQFLAHTRQTTTPRPLFPAGPAPIPAGPNTTANITTTSYQADPTALITTLKNGPSTTGRKSTATTTTPHTSRPVQSDHRTSRRMKVPIPRALQAEAHPAVSVSQQVGAVTEQIKVRISLPIAGLTLDSILRLHVEPELLQTAPIARPLSPQTVDLGNSSDTSWDDHADIPARPTRPGGSTASGTPGVYHVDAGHTPTPYAPASTMAVPMPNPSNAPGCMNHPATLLYDAARQFWYAQHGTQSLPGQAGLALAGGMVLPHLPLLSGEAKAVFHAAPDPPARSRAYTTDAYDDVDSLSSAGSADSDDGDAHGSAAIVGASSTSAGQHAHASDAVKRGANFIAAQALLGMRLSEEEAPFMTAVTSAQLRLARVSYRTRRPGTPTHRASRAQLYKLTRRMMTQSGGWTPSDIRAGVRWQSASSITHPAGPWRAHATPAPREDGGACTHSAETAQDRSTALKTYVASLTAPAHAQPGLIRGSAALGMTDAQAATALSEATHTIVADMEGCAMLHMLAKEAEANAAVACRAASDEQEPPAPSTAAPVSAACSPTSVAVTSPATARPALPGQLGVKPDAEQSVRARAVSSHSQASMAGAKRSATQSLDYMTPIASAPTLAAAARSTAWARTLSAANLMPTPLTNGQLRGAGHVSLPGAWYRHARNTLQLATPADLAPLESAHVALHEFIDAHCIDCAHAHPGQVQAVHRASPQWREFEALATACARACPSGAEVSVGSLQDLQAVAQVPCCTRPETTALYERMISGITRQFIAVFHTICPLAPAAQLLLLTGVMSSAGAPWIQRVLMQADHTLILQTSFDTLVQACSATLLHLATVSTCVPSMQWFAPGVTWTTVTDAVPMYGDEHMVTPEHRELVAQFSAPIVAAACALHAVVHRAWAMGTMHCPAGHFPEPQPNGLAAQLLARAVRRVIQSEAPGLQHGAVAMTVLQSTCWARFQFIASQLRGDGGSHVAWASPPGKPAARTPEPAKP